MRYVYICLVFFICGHEDLFADQCPTAEIVKQRKISRDYEWTIDERKTLEDVLAVEKLYSVRIKNRGDFVACYYTSEKGLLRLDAKAPDSHCLISQQSGSWDPIDAYETVCKENDLALCQFEATCTE